MALGKFSIVVLISTDKLLMVIIKQVCVGSRTLVFFCLAQPASSAPRVSLNLPLQVQGALVSTSLSTRCVPFGLGCRDMVHQPHLCLLLLLFTFLQCSAAKLQQDSHQTPGGVFCYLLYVTLGFEPLGAKFKSIFHIPHLSE